MSRLNRHTKGVVKGASSGILLSMAIHVLLFFLAGLLVVFTVYPRAEHQFDPPKSIERPKMKLRKPRVRIRKSGSPKSPARIVSTVSRNAMPVIQLPEMDGIGDGLGDGISGFGLMPDLGEVTVLGSSQSIGNDLEGTYYDLKFSRSGKYNPVTGSEWRHLFHQFFRNDWDPRVFRRFYRSPKKLYATFLLLPPSISAMAPVAFGMGDDMASGGLWIVHYKGKLVHKDGITFRFWVSADDSLAIRVDGEVVIAASHISGADGQSWRAPIMYESLWESSSLDSAKYHIGHSLTTVGDWITLEPGVAKDIEVVAADNAHANASFIVAVEEKGVEYERGRHNGPLLPIFRMEPLSHDQLDLIYQSLTDREVDCVNGPIFRDY